MQKIDKTLHTWEHIKTLTSRFSFMGPRRSKNTFKIVRLVVFVITPVLGFIVSSVSPKVDKTRRTKVVNFEGGFLNPSSEALDGYRRFVSASNLHAEIKLVVVLC